MQRILMDKLLEWKDDLYRKPLFLQGIKHSGKTYLLKQFGEKYFKSVLYFDFSGDANLADLFGQSSDPRTILKNLSIYLEKDIRPDETLIILDEVHLCPAALESLRHFCDKAKEYHIASAASFPAVSTPKGTSIPIGKVELLTLYPMNFYEFLLAQSPMLALHLKESGFEGDPHRTFKKQLADRFRDFQIVGGMPEAVECFVSSGSIEAVNTLQSQIIKSFESELATRCPANMLPKLLAVLNAIPAQLAKDNKKFMFSKVKKSWRGKDLDDAVYLLMRAGLIHKIMHIEKPEIPVSAHANPAHFKLYFCDVGLLRQIGQFPAAMIFSRENTSMNIKSAIAENIVCNELVRAYEKELYYWSAENPRKAEVDFIVFDGGEFIPIEVKAGSASKARSLLQFRMRFNPNKSVLTGMDNDKDDILPLYCFWNFGEWLRRKPRLNA